MYEFVPDAQRLADIFSTATAPTFFLGAVAAFASLMTSRIGTILDRIRKLNAIEETDERSSLLKEDLGRLTRRVQLLKDGMLAVLASGVLATILLAVLFMTEFLGLKYAYGAGLLFLFATLLLGYALFKFALEARISFGEADKY